MLAGYVFLGNEVHSVAQCHHSYPARAVLKGRVLLRGWPIGLTSLLMYTGVGLPGSFIISAESIVLLISFLSIFTETGQVGLTAAMLIWVCIQRFEANQVRFLAKLPSWRASRTRPASVPGST